MAFKAAFRVRYEISTWPGAELHGEKFATARELGELFAVKLPKPQERSPVSPPLAGIDKLKIKQEREMAPGQVEIS